MKIIDILKIVKTALKKEFENIPVMIEADTEDEIVRPSFLVSVDKVSSKDFKCNIKDKTTKIRFYYFPKNKYKCKSENYDVIERLYEHFLENASDLYVNELVLDENDGIVYGYFEVDASETNDEKDNENMDDIVINSNNYNIEI